MKRYQIVLCALSVVSLVAMGTEYPTPELNDEPPVIEIIKSRNMHELMGMGHAQYVRTVGHQMGEFTHTVWRLRIAVLSPGVQRILRRENPGRDWVTLVIPKTEERAVSEAAIVNGLYDPKRWGISGMH